MVWLRFWWWSALSVVYCWTLGRCWFWRLCWWRIDSERSFGKLCWHVVVVCSSFKLVDCRCWVGRGFDLGDKDVRVARLVRPRLNCPFWLVLRRGLVLDVSWRSWVLFDLFLDNENWYLWNVVCYLVVCWWQGGWRCRLSAWWGTCKGLIDKVYFCIDCRLCRGRRRWWPAFARIVLGIRLLV